jgi:hypothetical protein
VTTANRGGSARWTAEPPFESEPTTESSSVGSHATSSVASHAAPAKPGRARSVYGRWRAWRKSRPFVGALLGGTEILLAISAPLPVVIHFGVSNLIGFALPILMILCGLMLWFAPHPRAFYAMLILLSSLATWLTSNFGGFFLGMLLGIIGGSLALSWSPDKGPKRSKKAAEAATELD